MNNNDDIDSFLDDICDKYYEWLEMAGDDAPLLLARIVAQICLKEKEESEFCKRELKKCMRHHI